MEKRISHTDTGFRFMAPSVLWEARAILFYLIKKDMSVAYKQTLLGVAWAVLKPLVMSITIVLVFNKVGRFPDHGKPYVLIAIAAIAIWDFFSSSVGKGSVALVDERDLITKINFPRVMIPMSNSVSNFIGLFINLGVILILMIYFNIPFTVRLFIIPILLLTTVLVNFSVVLILSTVNVFYRDVSNTVPFALRIGLFISPVAFTFNTIPEEWRMVYCINPLVSIIELMRYSILGDQFFPKPEYILISTCTLIVMIVLSILLFGKYERRIADII